MPEKTTDKHSAWVLDGILNLEEFSKYHRKFDNAGFVGLYNNVYSKRKKDFEKQWWASESEMLGRFVFAKNVIDWSRVAYWLDLGCGAGDFFRLVLENKGQQVQEIVGVDMTNSLLGISSAKLEKFNLKKEFINKNITGINFNRKFDLITLSGVLQTLDIEQIPVLMDKISSCLKPGGQLWFDTLNYEHSRQRKWSDLWTFKMNELVKLFEHYGFREIKADTFDTTPEIGISKTGLMLSCHGILESSTPVDYGESGARFAPASNENGRAI